MYAALASPRKLVVVALLIALLGSIAGHVFAQVGWQSTQLYQSDMLKGQPAGKNWSPIGGQLSGKVLWEGGLRKTYAEANYHKRWNVSSLHHYRGA